MDSLWSKTVQLRSFPVQDGDFSTDILIVGGGLAGVLCAYLLQQAGADYALIEADTIGSGVTKNTTAKITAQHGLCYHTLGKRFGLQRAKLYLQSNLQALEEYRRLCAGMDCDFSEQSSYVYSLDDPGSLAAELAALKALDYPGKWVRRLPLPMETAGAIVFPRQAQFHPLKFLAATAKDLRIFEHTTLRELVPGAAVTDRGRITANKIIIATHFPLLNKHGSYFLKLYQHRSYCLALENVQPPEGMYVDASGKGLSFRSYDGLLLLGGGSHRTGKPGGGWEAPESFARDHFPGARIKYRWSTQDCMTLDGIPYIGQYSRRTPGLYVATGFHKWGMTGSMVAARLLTELMQGKASPYEQVYSPSRSILRPQLLTNALETTKNLLTPTAPRCPHLGCALKWNPREHSWDCPCHGSRFAEDGKLLDGPATGDLKKE